MTPLPPFILTLKLDAAAFATFDALRKAHFPSERNFLQAHLTLFHALPGDEGASIEETLRGLCARTPPLPLAFPQLRFLGRGVAVEVVGEEMVSVRQHLAATWAAWLSAQDRQGFRPHITIQNKVAPGVARGLFEALGAEWQPLTGQGEGLLLWRYLGGPWELASEFTFEG